MHVFKLAIAQRGQKVKRHIKLAILITLVIFLAACSSGRNIMAPQPSSLTIGQTTSAEIIQRFGKPFFKGKTNGDGEEIHHIGYGYSSSLEKAAFESVVPFRGLTFYCIDDILVGYYFTSSFMNDSTYFEPIKVKQVKKGITTRDQVINLFGTSYGEFTLSKFLPNLKKFEKDLKDEEGKGIWYFYAQIKRRGSSDIHYNQHLVVTFNKEDIVSNILFDSEGRF